MQRYRELRAMMNDAIRQVAANQKEILSTAQMKLVRKKLFAYYKKKMRAQQ